MESCYVQKASLESGTKTLARDLWDLLKMEGVIKYIILPKKETEGIKYMVLLKPFRNQKRE